LTASSACRLGKFREGCRSTCRSNLTLALVCSPLFWIPARMALD
jgi:hypothetical protein